ncbi:MAG: methylmalonyl-CoA epimerase [Acidimicrobiia bacterium]|nr:MAG: methylmalonyl-CoA epimerase [Acidimicrobiia bacterium]
MATVLPYNIHHVAIAVEDLEASLAEFDHKYNVKPISVETVEEQGVREAMIAIGGSHIQLLEPLDLKTPIGRFLSQNGEGMHHIALAVTDIEDALEHLQNEGARLIDATPRTGGAGYRVAFVHPADLAGTLIELVEVPDA